MRKTLKNLLSIFLAILFLMQVFPFSTIAQALNNTISENNVYATEDESQPMVIEELVAERTDDSKSFLMSDKSIVYAMYNTPIHYEENGELKEIDNTLIADDAKGADDFDGYINRSNSMKVKFSNEASSSTLMRIFNENRELSFQLMAGNSRSAASNDSVKLSNPEKLETEEIPESVFRSENKELIKEETEKYNRNKMAVSTTNASVKYENALVNTDIEYTVAGQSVKENIIVKDKQSKYVYSYRPQSRGNNSRFAR